MYVYLCTYTYSYKCIGVHMFVCMHIYNSIEELNKNEYSVWQKIKVYIQHTQENV